MCCGARQMTSATRRRGGRAHVHYRAAVPCAAATVAELLCLGSRHESTQPKQRDKHAARQASRMSDRTTRTLLHRHGLELSRFPERASCSQPQDVALTVSRWSPFSQTPHSAPWLPIPSITISGANRLWATLEKFQMWLVFSLAAVAAADSL